MKTKLFRFALGAAAIILVLNLLLYRMSREQKVGMVAPPHELLTVFPKNVRTAFQVRDDQKNSSACYRAYQSLYADGNLKIRIAFGYKDSRPSRFVGDRYEKLVLLHYLLSPCTEGRSACGFQRDRTDTDLLTKDGVVLRLTHSSVGPDDELNRVDPLQRVQSALSASNFFEGFRNADVVFYNGHSRDGGGPDFEPPKLAAHNFVNYEWYQRQKPGEKKLLDAVAGAKDRQRKAMLGLFSCRSSDHFLIELEKTGKLPNITSPRLYFYTDALRSMLDALNALLGRWCENDFNDVLNPKDGFGRARLKSFFGNG